MNAVTQKVAPSQRERVSGWSGSPDYFQFRERHELRCDDIIDVLYGRLAGVILRNVVSPKACAQLTEQFWSSPLRRKRGRDAPGYYMGTYHYHKSTNEYLNESEQVASDLSKFLDIRNEPLAMLRRNLAMALASRGVTLRLAQHKGRQACQALVRSWHGDGGYALAPHDDRSQCIEPRQADFEIQRVAGYQVVAVNICIENGDRGRLAYWNIQPDEGSKRRLGLHYTGSPYPPELLEGIEMKLVDIRPRDIYLFNGAHVHAVEPNTNSACRRTTVACLCGFIDDSTVVSWT